MVCRCDGVVVWWAARLLCGFSARPLSVLAWVCRLPHPSELHQCPNNIPACTVDLSAPSTRQPLNAIASLTCVALVWCRSRTACAAFSNWSTARCRDLAAPIGMSTSQAFSFLLGEMVLVGGDSGLVWGMETVGCNNDKR